jgi:hypothetical protein
MTSPHGCVKSESRLPWPEPTNARPMNLCISARGFSQALLPEVSESGWYLMTQPVLRSSNTALNWGGAAVSRCLIARTCTPNASQFRGRYVVSNGVDGAKCLSLLQGDVGAEGESSVGCPSRAFLRNSGNNASPDLA